MPGPLSAVGSSNFELGSPSFPSEQSVEIPSGMSGTGVDTFQFGTEVTGLDPEAILTGVLEAPPDSPFLVMLRRAVAIIESNAQLCRYFGWQQPSGDDEWDKQRRRRVFLDDNGTVTGEQSPKLVVCEIHQHNEFSLLGDGGDVDSDIEATIGIIVYASVSAISDGEHEQILVGNLHSAVRQVLRRECVERESGLWSDMGQVGPACSFDSSKGWRRAGGLISVCSQRRIT